MGIAFASWTVKIFNECDCSRGPYSYSPADCLDVFCKSVIAGHLCVFCKFTLAPGWRAWLLNWRNKLLTHWLHVLISSFIYSGVSWFSSDSPPLPSIHTHTFVTITPLTCKFMQTISAAEHLAYNTFRIKQTMDVVAGGNKSFKILYGKQLILTYLYLGNYWSDFNFIFSLLFYILSFLANA